MSIRVAVVAATAGLFAALLVPSMALAQEEAAMEEASATSEASPPEQVSEDPAAAVESTEAAHADAIAEAAASEEELSADPVPASTERSAVTQEEAASVTSKISTAKLKGNKKRKSKKARSCSASSRGGGLARIAQSGRPQPGCVRLDRGQFPGPLVLPDGTRLSFTETAQGEVSFTVSGGPTGTFTGTIFVKGGPQKPGFPCAFSQPVTSGTCHTPVNPNNNKFYGVSHVDACPGQFVSPGAPGAGPGPGRGGKPGGGGERGGEREEGGPGFAAAKAVIAAEAREQLPFTGLPALWLLLLGTALVGFGRALRPSARD
jgi:hypothetical protein